MGPAALATDAQIAILCEPRHRRQHAALGRVDGDVEAEAIIVGAAVERDAERVAAIERARGQIDDRAAAANIGVARDGRGLGAARDAGRDRQLADRKLHQANVEAGQDRSLPLGRIEFGQFVQGGARDHQPVDVQPVGQPGEGPPFQFDPGRIEEAAIGVGQDQVMQHCLAIDAAVDPADADLQAGPGLDGRDARHEEAMPRPGIEPGERSRHDQQQRGEQPRDPALPAPVPGTAADRRGGGGGFVGHQKA